MEDDAQTGQNPELAKGAKTAHDPKLEGENIERENQNSLGKKEMSHVVAKKHGLPWFFWVAAVILATIVVIKHTRLGHKNLPVRIVIEQPKQTDVSEPTAEEVEELQKKRQQELERQKLELEKKKLLADVELRIQKYRGDIAATVEKWRKMLPLSEAEAFFKKSEEGASFISSREGLCGFKCCVALAYKMAYDKVKGTTRAEDAVFPIVKEKVVDDIERAVNVYSKWTDDFQKQLEAENMALAADFAVRSQKFERSIVIISDEKAKDIGKALDAFVNDIQNHASDAAFSVAGLALEAVMIQSSYSAIKKGVVSLSGMALSGAVTRASASAAAGGAASVADGPLPIGDVVGAVITVAGLSWSAYDIYRVTHKLPTEMKAKIHESISQTHEALNDAALKNLKDAQERCNSFADRILSEVSNIMEE